jgi:hypothetical protein
MDRKNAKLDDQDIIDVKDQKRPDFTFDLNALRDYNNKSDNRLWISMITLIIFFTIVVKTNSDDIPRVCDFIIPIMTLIIGYFFGKKTSD